MSISSTDYALLSQDSYQDHALKDKVMLGSVQYEVLDHANDPRTGYQGTAYKRLDTGEIIIAHRGTEFGREPVHDGGVDAGMVLVGVNAQTPDAMAFTRKVLAEAKSDSERSGRPVNVTVTGHSLGGTLAEITAYECGLHGETFNAYGAAGLLQGIPKGGHQVIDHVRAGDVVSAGSQHFGEVHIYAAQQDIDTLSKAGYRDDGGALSIRNPVKAIDFGAHAIDNFVPHSETLGQSIINPESEARYRAHHGMIDRYRSDVLDLRTGLSASWELPRAAVETGVAVGHAAAHEVAQGVHAVEHGARYVAHEAVQGAHAVEHTAQTVAHAVHDDVVKGVHAVEHGAQYVAREAAQGVRAVEHGVQHAAQAVERTATNAAHAVRENVSQGLQTAGHAAAQGVHAAERAAQSLASDASSAFETLRHPGSWFDDKPSASVPARLDHITHPDNPLYQQTRGAVHRLDAEHHRTPDQHSDNLAAALTVAARRDGLSEVHHAVLSDDASRTFAVQGELSSAFKQITHVETAKASNTPIEQSSAAWQQVMQLKQPEPVRAPQVTQEAHPQPPHPVAGM